MFKARVIFENCSCNEIVDVVNIQIIPRTRTTHCGYGSSEIEVENHDEITVIYVDSDGDVKSDTVRNFNNIEII